MRKIASLVLCLGLAAALRVSALAAGSAEIVRAFVYEGTLYTYVSMDGMEKPVTKAEARVGGQTFSATDRLETVRQAGAPVTWLLLADNSTSMPTFREEIEIFVQSLSRSGGENTRFILATFGDDFNVVAEDVPAGELAERVGALPFDERVTRLHTAISRALDCFEEMPRERNELRCMVVLSDAVQYDPRGGVPYEELLERVSQSDVMLHSVGLGTDQASLDSLGRLASASGGIHQEVDVRTAEEAAVRLAESGGGLYVTGFDLSGLVSRGGVEQVSVTFAAGGELVCRAEAQVELPELTGEAGAPGNPGPREGPLPPAGDTAPSSGNPPAAADGQGLPAGLIAAAAGAVVLAVAAAVLLRRKKGARPNAKAAPRAEEAQTGIYMRVDMLQGTLAGGQSQMELELSNELTVGNGPACDVVLTDGAAASRHARLFVSEGAVYLENLCGERTAVNGAELQGPKRLYSGDAITVGNTVFQFKF